jgi:hypothetical protein
MSKMTTKQKIKLAQQNTPTRETKILNVICNTSLLLMSLVTEAFSEMFTKLSKETITTLITSLDGSEDTTKDIHKETNSLHKELPQQMREQLLVIKTDITTQLQEKRKTRYCTCWSKIRQRNNNRRTLQIWSPFTNPRPR